MDNTSNQTFNYFNRAGNWGCRDNLNEITIFHGLLKLDLHWISGIFSQLQHCISYQPQDLFIYINIQNYAIIINTLSNGVIILPVEITLWANTKLMFSQH